MYRTWVGSGATAEDRTGLLPVLAKYILCTYAVMQATPDV